MVTKGAKSHQSRLRLAEAPDSEDLLAIVNAAAVAYRGAIPDDCWSEPYMTSEELAAEIEAGVVFWAHEEGGDLLGMMGLQPVEDVVLIRHAYVRPAHQGRGIGSELLEHLTDRTTEPLLVGTWAGATWAVRFYERHGFRLVSAGGKDALLGRYWSIPPRQREASVVLADARWWAQRGG